MIIRLRGIILEKRPPKILLENNGIGYELHIPMISFSSLPEEGKEAILFTHFIISEKNYLLFGFINKEELILFIELIKTNGVGAKLAIAILSGMSIKNFINVIETNDIKKLLKLPGIGKKTAERLVLEMKDKVKELIKNNLNIKSLNNKIIKTYSLEEEEKYAISALIYLGYKHKEATRLVKKVTYAGADCESLILYALRVAL